MSRRVFTTFEGVVTPEGFQLAYWNDGINPLRINIKSGSTLADDLQSDCLVKT